ncbi:MAG TPA: hypothetical protein VFU89_06380, partial [Rhabdochlamydiaceae bacterium]|nr:hypothetical protein [Rhabdochlamydiaceae bacterium]
LGNVGTTTPGITSGLTLNSGVAGTGIFLNGGNYNTSGGAQHFIGNVQIGTTAVLTSTGNNIVFNNKIDGALSGAQGLILRAGAGAATFTGLVGSSTPLSILDVTAAGNININNGGISTTSTQTYNSNTVLGANTTLTTMAGGSQGAAVTFGSTVNATGVGAQNLTVTAGIGAVNMVGNMGAGTALGALTLTGDAGVRLGGNVFTTATGGQTGNILLTSKGGVLLASTTYTATAGGSFTATGDLTIDANATINTTNAAVLINGNVDGSTAGVFTLTGNTANGNLTINGDVGSRNSLVNLVATVGTGTITLGNIGNSSPGITTGLTLNSGAAGTGIFLNGGNYNTSGGAQHYTGNVQLGISATLTSNNQAITFDNKIDGAAANAEGLTLQAGTGVVTLTGLVGSTNPLYFLNVSGSLANINNNGITTSSFQNYNTPVSLGADSTFTTTNSPVTFTSTINGAHNLTVSAGTGSVLAQGAIGGTAPLHLVTMTGNGGVTVGAITTTSGSAAVSLTSATGILMSGNINTAAGTGTVTANGNTTLNTNVAITTAASAVSLNGDVDGFTSNTESLTIDTTNGGGSAAGASVAIAGDIGSRNALTTLSITSGTSGTITLGNIGTSTPGIATGGLTLNSGVAGTGIFLNGGNYNTTGGAQHYTGNVQLGISATLTSNNQAITFDNKIDGAAANAEGLTLQAGTGVVTLTGLVGSTHQLLSLNVSGSGGINVNNGGITTLNNQLYNNQVLLGANATFTTTNSPVVFASTINGTAGQILTVNVGNGPIVVGGAIGSSGVAIGAITMTGNGGVTLNGIGTGTPGAGAVSVTSKGGLILNNGTYSALSHSYTAPVTLAATTTITSVTGQNVTVMGSIDGDGVATRSLSVITPGAGTSTVTGSIGERFALGTLTMNSNTISVGGIGGAELGVSGTTTLTAAANINFTGSAYFANNPTYTAGSNFNIQSTIPTNFNSLVGDINFVTGTVNLTTVTSSLVITTDNTNVSIPSVAGIVGANGHLLISTGTGAVTVGDAPVSFLDVTLNSGAVTLTGNITGDTINVISGTSISNSGGPWTLTATDTILLDAEGGNVGTVGSPINLAIAAGHSGPIVTVGAGLADAGGGTVFLTGATGDAKVHCLPDNPPAHIFFNGVDIGCTGTTPCPACLPCLPCHPTIVITNNLISFVSISNFQAVGGAVYDPFGFSLASDFFFRQDKAASGNCTTATDCSSGKCIGTTTCDCTYNVYNSLRDLDTKCMANNIYTSKPKRKVSPWLLGFLAAAVALVLHRRFYSMNKKP